MFDQKSNFQAPIKQQIAFIEPSIGQNGVKR